MDNNIPQTITTSSKKTNVDFFIERFDLGKWFTFIKIVFDDNTLPSKHAPDIYIRAAKKIKVEPKHCIVVEDAKSGMRVVKLARIRKVYALGPKCIRNSTTTKM